jgi:hypothetical protein
MLQAEAINNKPEFRIELHIKRKPNFWCWVIVVPNLGCSLVGLTCLVLSPTDLNDRIGIVLTLILTTVAFKFTVNERMPILPYLTLLDGWLLAMFSIYLVVAFENVVVFLLTQPKVVPHRTDYDAAHTLDVCTFTFFLTFITTLTGWMVLFGKRILVGSLVVSVATVAAVLQTPALMQAWPQISLHEA